MTVATIVPPGCYVDELALVHPSCVLARNVWIGPHVTIGENCVIGPGAVIGCDGFGYNLDAQRWWKKPESHGVVIGDDVHIGANTCIDRGSYRDTTIGDGTKIDNLVHIAHNCVIGRNCLVIAHAELSGSVEVGDGAWVGPSACVREHLSIGAGALVGLGAVVVKHVQEGQTVIGNPARPLSKAPPPPEAPSRPIGIPETQGGAPPPPPPTPELGRPETQGGRK
jgi:UDP-3-O-[3-hydroxymyristoyl] glucosamine N-acyltransferase